MLHITLRFSLLTLLSLLIPLPSAAADGPTAAYALAIGSNSPGSGQKRLNYAHEDATRLGSVLTELNGYAVQTLFDPDADRLRSAIGDLHETIRDHADRDEKSTFIFYYSGHARANALNLGADEVPLTELRDLLEAIPATVKIIILDACQTGAMSNVKGVEPAADFSHNSVNSLKNEGTIILASSTAAELAQESDRLQGSFFTHHLVAALRGAADKNRDGRVTLSEAYQYAYDRTLVDTSKTAVGKQHVTLETALVGEGEMVLSRTDVASAWLELPKGLFGEILLFRKRDRHVMAEVHKAKNDVLRLALPPDDYEATVRQRKRVFSCGVTLKRNATVTLDIDRCEEMPVADETTKGAPRRRTEHLFFELGIGGLVSQRDAYDRRLDDFGYRTTYLGKVRFHYALAAYYAVLRYLQVGLMVSGLDRGSYDTGLSDDPSDKEFRWSAYRVGVHVRGVLPLANDWLVLYIQAGGGLGWAKTAFKREVTGDTEVIRDEERFVGYHVGGGGGMQVNFIRNMGVFWQGAFAYAPIIENLAGDTHDSGGAIILSGIRAGF